MHSRTRCLSGIECFNVLCISSSESWHSFLESSLLEELRLHLQLGNLHEASCIWSRHQVKCVCVCVCARVCARACVCERERERERERDVRR